MQVAAQHCECTECHRTVCSRTVKMVDFVLGVFYNLKIIHELESDKLYFPTTF